MEVARLGVESELQLPAYATVTAKWDLSHVCGLHHSSWWCQILNPLTKARDWTHILIDTSWVHNPLSHSGNSVKLFHKTFKKKMKYFYTDTQTDNYFLEFLELANWILSLFPIWFYTNEVSSCCSHWPWPHPGGSAGQRSGMRHFLLSDKLAEQAFR